MSLTTDTVDVTAVSGVRRRADFFELTKPRIVFMVLVTAFVGFYVGSEQIPEYLRCCKCCSAPPWQRAARSHSISLWNATPTLKWSERAAAHYPMDGCNRSTRFGLGTLTLSGLAYLAVAVNIESALVTALITVSYLLRYTPMKRRSSLCMLVGAVPGALPR